MARARMPPPQALMELGRIRLRDTDLQGVLTRVAELARASLPGAAEVSVTLVRDRRGHTAAFTGELAIDLDETQYERGHGPCLQAAVEESTISIPDLRAESRWPDFAPLALKRGVHSALSIGLPIEEDVHGALNLYGLPPGAFDQYQIDLATTYAGYAAVAVSNADLVDSTATLADQVQESTASRAVIEQAKGILMGQRRCTPDEALQILARLSHETKRELRHVAADVVQQAQHGAGGFARGRSAGATVHGTEPGRERVPPTDVRDAGG